MEDNKEKEYHFLKEEKKKIPTNKKKFCKKLGVVILFAAVFGVVACLAFCLLKPVVQKHQEAKTTDLSSLTQKEPEGTADVSGTDVTGTGETEGEPDQIIIQETVALSIDEYEALQTQLYSIGNQARRSVVEINSVTNETDWFDAEFETKGQSSGVILSTEGSEILILSETDMIADANEISVTFYDETKATAYLKAYDAVTGLAVIAVDQKEVNDTTKSMILATEIAETNTLKSGSFVIAVGSPQGEAFSVVVGNITSSNKKVSFADKNCRLYATNIEAYQDTRGVLLNVDGQMVGIISQSEESDAVKAISVTELKGLLTKLMAGKRPAYLGLEFSEITMSVSEEYNLPDGIYIKKVDMDSPAAAAGLQVGDIITKIDGNDVLTELQYENYMITAEPEQKITVTVKRLGSNDQYHDVTCKVILGVDN